MSTKPVVGSTRRVRRRVVALSAATVVGLAATGCGGDDGASARSDAGQISAADTTPEERQVSDAEVTAGLTAMKPLVAAAAASVATDAASGAFEPIEATWRTFEGTVRTKEQDLYLAIEDGFAALQQALADKDAAAATKAQAAIDDAASQYLAQHP
jgi:hypothetical protein